MILWKKAFRDIIHNKGSYVACLVVTIIGLMAFTSFSISRDNLQVSTDIFYREQSFAHGFIEMESMPQGHLDRILQVEGIQQVSGRIIQEVRVHHPQRRDSVYLELVSLDLADPRRVNDVLLLEGEELTPRRQEAWIDEGFFAANQLSLYDEVKIIAGGRVRDLTLVGVGMSPEYTYALRDEKSIYPDPEAFGIAFLPYRDMEHLFPGMAGRVNSVVFTLEEGADFDLVKDRLEPLLDGYGLQTIYPREDQISHFILKEELDQLDRFATAFPLLFLTIAGIILYIMLKRIVEQQRGQIGVLKAIGYTTREIMYHYLSYAFLMGTFGGLAGGVLGIWGANPLTALLMEFFKVPPVYIDFSLYYLFMGIILSLAIFLFAGYQGCKLALQLKPAEALRPPAPPSTKKPFLERIGPYWALLTIQGKMATRNIFRNQSRSGFILLGIMLSYAVAAIVWNFNDMIDKLVFYHYEEVEVHDARVTLNWPGDRNSLQRELEGYDNAARVEPLAEVPVTLSHGWREEQILVIGVPRGSRLYRILDDQGRKVEPSPDGLILPRRMADKLQVTPGSYLTLESPLSRWEDREIRVRVQEVIPQYIGMNGYMEISALERVLEQSPFATSLLVELEEKGEEGVFQLKDHYWESEKIAGIDGREELIGATRELMEAFGAVLYIYVLVGVVMAFAIIYSSSFIILSERSREMASMRVLGMTPGEVFSVITFEQWLLSIFGMLVGIPLAQLIQQSFAQAMSTDIYVIPRDIEPVSLLVGLLITVGSIWIAQRFALKKVEKLSLIEVLKTGE
ncbi:MAG: FtsX-like permease family protein [Candidatus Syntrophonatronum acetioxidans]|uniref:FtsX-like permease family protein n=1 Tax=Candidatus Syntrophonatronum acetioxidans TaxID=1795816 RepID=A0A424YE80_9FIRM|nr:MAG: FtsX-like permease family protein [Candidatus Syntrophonatronum acetioxidans]